MQTFQQMVTAWAIRCFGTKDATDKSLRNHRFLEEALGLVQALGTTKEEANKIVDYVYGRPIGDPVQEVGGTVLTLAVLCSANKIDLSDAGNKEIVRVNDKLEEIQRKHAAKPRFESS